MTLVKTSLHCIFKLQGIYRICCKVQECPMYAKISRPIENFSFKNVLKFLRYVSIYVVIYIKKTSLHKGNLSAESIGNWGTQFFCMPFQNFWCMRVPRRRNVHLVILFLEIMNQIVYLKWAIFNSLLFRVLLHNPFCGQYFVPLKRIFSPRQKRA